MSWRPVVIMAIIALAIWQAFEYGYDSGMATGLNKTNEANQTLIEQLKKQKQSIEAQLSALDTRYTTDMINMQEKIDDAKKQAAQYVPPQKNDCDCSTLDPEWVRVHDAAASVSGVRNSEPTSVDDGNAKTTGNDQAGYSTKRAIEVITDNYSACSIYINQLEALQGFVRTLQKNGASVGASSSD